MAPSDADHSLPAQRSRSHASADEEMRDEIEAKFLLEDAATVAQVLDAFRARHARSVSAVEIVDRYWDAPNWRLLKEGWTYRWREASGQKSLALKSAEPSHGVVQRRRELEQRVVTFPESGEPIPFGPVTERVLGIWPGELRELFRVHNYRRLFHLRALPGELIEVAIDQATITAEDPGSGAASGRMAFVELELELREGPEESLLLLVDDMRRLFRVLPSRLNKFERGLQTAGLSGSAAMMRHELIRSRLGEASPERPLSHADRASELAHRCLKEQFEEMLAEEPKAWEGLDPEGVHKMRVAIRRLRVAFRSFKDVLPARPVLAYNREFKRAAAVLGEVRDLDVNRGNLERYAAGIPPEDAAHLAGYRRHLIDRQRRARRRLVAYLASRRHQRLKDRFARFLERGPSRRTKNAGDSATVGEAARRLVRKRYGRLLADGCATGPGGSDESYHALRIQCRRLRYLLEFFRATYGEGLRPAIEALKELQDVLGELQDVCVATAQLQEYAERVPARSGQRAQFLVLGQLVGSQRHNAEVRRGQVGDAWKRFDRKRWRKRVLAVFATASSASD